MENTNFALLMVGDRVRVIKSGKIYQVLAQSDGGWPPSFRQWREDRQALYGPSFVRLKPENIEAV